MLKDSIYTKKYATHLLSLDKIEKPRPEIRREKEG